jgi:hypothetical protein
LLGEHYGFLTPMAVKYAVVKRVVRNVRSAT